MKIYMHWDMSKFELSCSTFELMERKARRGVRQFHCLPMAHSS